MQSVGGDGDDDWGRRIGGKGGKVTMFGRRGGESVKNEEMNPQHKHTRAKKKKKKKKHRFSREAQNKEG